jgi:glucose-1-phosphate cytidylyltransferase
VKAVILAGGLGTRIAEESDVRPKPMVEIGGKPILWHLMKLLSAQGLEEFVICLGYRGYLIKEYFANYALHNADVTFDFAAGTTHVHQTAVEPWRVTLVETGEGTQTGGRLRRVAEYVRDEEAFLFTYGDGLADLDLAALTAFHRAHGRRATVTGVQPTGRFGGLGLDGDTVQTFREKPPGDDGWVNGGFFLLDPAVIDHVDADETIWEREPVERLAADDDLRVYRHRGFWQPMDTLRDRRELEARWAAGDAPWRLWP